MIFADIIEPDLYQVGFRLDSLSLIRYMSGLVEVIDAVHVPKDNALVFIVRRTDKTKTIFEPGGFLVGAPISKYRRVPQGISVSSNLPFIPNQPSA
jgi:hypothetical protein